MKDFAMLFLVTFLFAYLTFYSAKKISQKINSKFEIKSKFVKKLLSTNAIVSYIYIFMIVGFVFFISHLVPVIINELNNLARHIPIIEDYVKGVTSSLNMLKDTKEVVSSDLDKVINEKNISILINSIDHIKSVGGGIFKLVIAFILSYFFVIDRKRLHKYLEGIKESSVKFLYVEYSFLFKNIARGFLLIFRAQAKIAIANTILTYLGILVINLILRHSIPYIGILIFIVFIFSFVPVLGVIISSLPIMLIYYNISGIQGVIYVILMILIIHAIEAYILNPKFVSKEVELPVSLTFLILLVGEHVFGPIGLIISVPIFYISINVFGDLDKRIKNKVKIKEKEIKKKEKHIDYEG